MSVDNIQLDVGHVSAREDDVISCHGAFVQTQESEEDITGLLRQFHFDEKFSIPMYQDVQFEPAQNMDKFDEVGFVVYCTYLKIDHYTFDSSTTL